MIYVTDLNRGQPRITADTHDELTASLVLLDVPAQYWQHNYCDLTKRNWRRAVNDLKARVVSREDFNKKAGRQSRRPA